ncbi:MAG: chromosome segregation protein SMC [Clostridia bacterium]|nr:chromosome segregation protein SMC [Clostridia bacterium]
MRLKSIEMQGFKSFADKIYLDFNPGITAIVGPNGSGKSNISDAIRWVMGEQSAKSLRGSKMEDVIFSGTEERKPLGFAEVTLVLDNSDHYFALDFPEITVTRRVYRSGEGEYYINKTLCRLKDIHELFMDTGLGRDGYSIIGQGKIDNILSTKSEDRRQIFEEAAGISKYKYRKIEAERKLTQATENLTRVEDILGELESRLEPLRVQSEKAKKYLLLRDEMRGLDITVSVIHAEQAKAELKELNQNIEILASQIKDVQGEMEATEAEITAMYNNMEEYDKEIIACREAEQGAISSIHEEKNQMTIHQNDMEHNRQNIARLEEEVKTGMAAIAEIDKVIAEHSEVLAALDAKNQGTCETLEALTEKSMQAGRDANAKNDAVENIKAEMIDLLAKINALRADCNSLDMLVVNFKERQTVLEKDLNDKVESRTELKQGQKNAAQAAAACETEIKQEEDAQKQAENDIFLAEQKLRKMQETQNQNMLAVDQKRSRKKMLLDMEREYEGYARGVKCVMTAVDDGKLSKAKIYGPLSKLIRTERKYIAAIETALGAANQNIVTAREEDAKTAINYLKNSKQGRATFLPISAIKAKTFDLGNAEKQAGFLSIASDLVDCDKIYQNIISNLLGGTVVCDTMDNAVEMAKKNNHKFRIVTLDGDVIQPGGAMTGGSRNKNTSSLFRTGEIEALEKEIDALNKTLEQEAKEQEALLTELENKKLQFKEMTERMQGKRTELVQLQAEEKRFQDLLQGVSQSAEQAEKEHADILTRIAGLEKDKEAKNLEIDAKNNICARLEAQIAAAQKEYSDLSSQNELLISQLTELNLARNTILKDMELEQDRISRLNTEKAQHLEGITTKNGGMQMLRNRNQDAADAIAESNKKVVMLEQALEDARKRLEELSQNRAQTELRVREQQDSMKDVQEQVFSLTQQQNKMEAKAEKFETEIETIVNRLLEEYELPYSEAASMKRDEDFDFKNASQRIRELRDKIRGLGNINIDAIEEYKNIKERFEFLSTQASDLQKAKGELEAVIEEMLSIMQTRFAEQFRVINTNFNRVFAELFGGGRANLTLTEPDNILESGIEIEAQPPGKKLQSLTLLSGGERAFTAIALLFAILDVRPTPFCILDEIEAALDDVNVYRTAQYLKNYSDKTQFIVVTHRRGTMEAANILYGVTMQERGISKLLSLNIDEIQE